MWRKVATSLARAPAPLAAVSARVAAVCAQRGRVTCALLSSAHARSTQRKGLRRKRTRTRTRLPAAAMSSGGAKDIALPPSKRRVKETLPGARACGHTARVRAHASHFCERGFGADNILHCALWRRAAAAAVEEEVAPKRVKADAPASPPPPAAAGTDAAAAAAAPAPPPPLAATPPRPRLWVPEQDAAASARAAAAAATAAAAPPAGATQACDVCGQAGAWASGVGVGAEAHQPLCAACRTWRRFPRVGAHANIAPGALPAPRRAAAPAADA
jgi:hypothetical protein